MLIIPTLLGVDMAETIISTRYYTVIVALVYFPPGREMSSPVNVVIQQWLIEVTEFSFFMR